MTSPARKLLRNGDAWPLQAVRRGYGTRLFGLLAAGARKYQKLYFNEDYFNMQQNGEELVIRVACEELGTPFIALDVGANRGDWAAAVKDVSPTATVHCFEPVPSTIEELTARFEGVPGVVVRPSDFRTGAAQRRSPRSRGQAWSQASTRFRGAASAR